MKSLLIASAALASAATPCGSSGTTTPVKNNLCVTNHAVPDGIQIALPEARQRAAEGVCDNIRFSDLSQLPPELAGAGCTASGSYQLGLGQKPARYAICAAANGTCAAPKGTARLPCNPSINKFVTAYQNEGGTYDFAHTVTSVCDACLGNLALTSTVMVVWHENAHCFDDNRAHNATIEQETGALPPQPQVMSAQPAPAQPPPPGGSGSCSPLTTCAGGCMAPGAPAGL
jgi:hypothetical protein